MATQYYTYGTDGPCELLERHSTGNIVVEHARPYLPLAGIGNRAAATLNTTQDTYYPYDASGLTGNIVRMTNAQGVVTGSFEYNAWGLKLQNSPPPEGTRYGMSAPAWIELKDDPDGELVVTESGRVYDAKIGRYLQRDPTSRIAGGYVYVRNNPVIRVDPDGRAEIALPGIGTVIDRGKTLAELKQAIADMVTGTAELSHEVFMEVASFAQQHPWVINALNVVVDAAKPELARFVNTNTDTLTWRDLVFIWLLELNGNPIVFGPNAHTTKVLKEQEGVQKARELAKNAKVGDTIHYTWVYGQREFWNGLTEGNWCTSFLGSYEVIVKVVQKEGGKCVNKFTVKNTTSWESGTRLRKPAQPGGGHQGIIPNRKRGGPGIHLGGNMDEEWHWEEDR